MSIYRSRIEQASARDTYILLMSKEERDQALKDKLISQADLDRVGAPLTDKEKSELFKQISFSRLLFLISKKSVGETEVKIDKITKTLEKLKDYIDKLNQAMDYARGLSEQKDPKDQRYRLYDKFHNSNPPGLDDVLDDLHTQFPDLDLSALTGTKESQGQHKDGMTASNAINAFQTLSSFCDGKIKSITPEITKSNSEMNTLLELLSFVAKKVMGDFPQAVIRNV